MAASTREDMGSMGAITAAVILADTLSPVPAAGMAVGTGEDLVEATAGDLAAVAATVVAAVTVVVDTGKVSTASN
jgi:hypothetical protein